MKRPTSSNRLDTPYSLVHAGSQATRVRMRSRGKVFGLSVHHFFVAYLRVQGILKGSLHVQQVYQVEK